MPVGKPHNERWTPVEEQARTLIARLQFLRTLPPATPPEFLLPRPKGRGVLCAELRASLSDAAREAGIPVHIVPHQLRHTYATSMLRAGVSLPAPMKLLGHRTANTTLRYVEITQKDLQGAFSRTKARERGTRLKQQRQQKPPTMLANLPLQRDIGAKKNSKGHEQYWRGYKLHLDVAAGQLPISVVLTSASVHDSQAAIPLMTMTTQRVDYLYDLMDSAYDAENIHGQSRELNHVPIIAIHGRRGTKQPSQMPKVFPTIPTPELTWAEQERYKTRTMSERVNARLKDGFGASHLRVRGAVRAMAHLMFGVLALTVDQWLRMQITR